MFTIMKTASPAIAAAEAHEQHLAEQPGSQMARGARKPLADDQDNEMDQDDDAVKASQRHPLNGRFVSDQTTYGATHGPLAQAMAMHRPHPAPLAAVQTAGTGALAGSINPGQARLQHLDFRAGSGPVATAVSPIRPPFHSPAGNQQ